MKIYTAILLFLILSCAGFSFAQKTFDKRNFSEEIEKIMKSRLVDSLGFDATSADRYINLYKEKNNEIRNLVKEKRDVMKSIEADPSSADVNQKFNNILNLETRILDIRKKFFNDLEGFLNSKQIANALIMCKELKKDIKKEFRKHKKDKRD